MPQGWQTGKEILEESETNTYQLLATSDSSWSVRYIPQIPGCHSVVTTDHQGTQHQHHNGYSLDSTLVGPSICVLRNECFEGTTCMVSIHTALCVCNLKRIQVKYWLNLACDTHTYTHLASSPDHSKLFNVMLKNWESPGDDPNTRLHQHTQHNTLAQKAKEPHSWSRISLLPCQSQTLSTFSQKIHSVCALNLKCPLTQWGTLFHPGLSPVT